MIDTRPGGYEGKEEKMMKAVKMVINSRKARRLVKAVREVAWPLSAEHRAEVREERTEDYWADLKYGFVDESTTEGNFVDNDMFWETWTQNQISDARNELEWQLSHNHFSASQEAGLRQYA